MMCRHLFACVALLSVFTPAGVQAQTIVQGYLREGATATPIEGALVVLQRESGEIETGALTGSDGRFRLRAVEGGSFKVQAEHIGYRVVTTDLFEVAEDETKDLDLVTEVEAITLAGVDVSVEGQCRIRPDEGHAAYELWKQVEKALRGASIVQDHELIEYSVQTYRREVSLIRGGTRDQRDEARRVRGQPFQTLPAEVLAGEGYVRTDGDNLLYYGPDVQVLLSDSFRDTHCFRVETDDDDGLIGLAFQPLRDRAVADIAGVMWLELRSGELSHLTYEYTGVDAPRSVRRGGGYVAFERLPVGAWIVRSWWIRVPEFGVGSDWSRQGERREMLYGYVESGGEVTEVELSGADTQVDSQ